MRTITTQITGEAHRQRHVELHNALDELVADFITHRGAGLLTKTPIMDLLMWSADQTRNPTPWPKPQTKLEITARPR